MPEDKPKRPPSSWIVALKAWNTEKGGPWCVPRKGTPEYDQVRALMPAPKPRAKKPQATTAPTEPEAPIAEASASRKGKAKAKPSLKVDTKKKPRKPTIDLSDSPL